MPSNSAANTSSSSKKSKNVSNAPRDTGILFGDDPHDIWKTTRNACLKVIVKALETAEMKNNTLKSTNNPIILANKYENILYKRNIVSLNSYKSRFRKDYVALLNQKTSFADDLLSGKLSIEEFTQLDENDLISRKQRERNTKLLDLELKSKLGKKFPKTINEIENQNVLVIENWGISESAAKIDPQFDSE